MIINIIVVIVIVDVMLKLKSHSIRHRQHPQQEEKVILILTQRSFQCNIDYSKINSMVGTIHANKMMESSAHAILILNCH